jgi:hypothetical protein
MFQNEKGQFETLALASLAINPSYNLAVSSGGSIKSLQELQASHLLFKKRKFTFSAAELFGRACGSVESEFPKTCSLREDGLEVAYRRHLRSLINQELTCSDETLLVKDIRRIPNYR